MIKRREEDEDNKNEGTSTSDKESLGDSEDVVRLLCDPPAFAVTVVVVVVVP